MLLMKIIRFFYHLKNFFLLLQLCSRFNNKDYFMYVNWILLYCACIIECLSAQEAHDVLYYFSKVLLMTYKKYVTLLKAVLCGLWILCNNCHVIKLWKYLFSTYTRYLIFYFITDENSHIQMFWLWFV